MKQNNPYTVPIISPPPPWDSESARDALARWQKTSLSAAPFSDRTCSLLQAMFGASPYLSASLFSEPELVQNFVTTGPDAIQRQILTRVSAAKNLSDVASLYPLLRVEKRRMALLAAMADIEATWDLETVTRALSDFASHCLDAGIAVLLRQAALKGDIILPNEADPHRHAGLVLIGMGKLGSYELNYSSDIDLIALYDPRPIDYRGRRTVQDFYVRLTRDLVQLMQERTEDGYVFRTDLRLRPDPASTPLAISVSAAETYYESMGLNWERAAMIKARPVAGDISVGEDFLRHISPFIWRRHLDFAAIRDIHAIKRQIHQEKGHDQITVPGHDLKRGRGGIREIEFFAQTQQLIWGGRDPRLRVADTCGALQMLAATDRITAEAAAALQESYGFLRHLEHRLQMIDDQQTHQMPCGDQELARLACFAGLGDAPMLELCVQRTLRTVEKYYSQLFEDEPDSNHTLTLHLSGPEEGSQNLDQIQALGFRNARIIDTALRDWMAGRYRATRNQRAREILENLIPKILHSFGSSADPDACFTRFDNILRRLPAGVHFLSLLASNPRLLNLLAEIVGTAPVLAESLIRNPALMDAVLDIGTNEISAFQEYQGELGRLMDTAQNYETSLDIVRRWARDRQFHACVSFLHGRTDIERLSLSLSMIADLSIQAVYGPTLTNFMDRQGPQPGRGLGIVALGKLGSAEMSFGSDLDLIFIYDDENETQPSLDSGASPRLLQPIEFYGKLAQRLIAAISAETGEGSLYPVDMRLRPSGNTGPIASSLNGFANYQTKDAWTWEHMALTRARTIAGDPNLARKINQAIHNTLAKPRDPQKLRQDILQMRDRIARQFPPDRAWDVKYRHGGLIDVEFITQYLILDRASSFARFSPGTIASLRQLVEHGAVNGDHGNQLIEADLFWRGLQTMLRLLIGAGDPVEPARFTAPMIDKLCQAGNAVSFDDLIARMNQIAKNVMAIYDYILKQREE